MECYIRSCGKGSEHGYCWVNLTIEGQNRVEPTMLAGLKISDLIEHEAFSVGLERRRNVLVLLITGIRASGSDYQRRRITHSLALRAPPDQETTLRAVAAKALRGELEQMFETGIRFRNRPDGVGFVVRSNLLSLVLLHAAGGADPSPQEGRIGKDTPTLRASLAQELDTHTLPTREGPLVLVTRNTDPGRLRLANLWRALSRLFDAHKNDADCEWQEMYRVPLNLQGKDLRHSNLQDIDLRYANLSRSDLRYADLSRSDLRHADLSQTNLAHANLSGADLRYTNFWRAFYFFTEFRGAIGNNETRWPFFFFPIGAINVDRVAKEKEKEKKGERKG